MRFEPFSTDAPLVARAVGRCPTCGKLRYLQRRDAKRAARRLYPHEALRAYRCGEFWHVGRTQPRRKRGEVPSRKTR